MFARNSIFALAVLPLCIGATPVRAAETETVTIDNFSFKPDVWLGLWSLQVMEEWHRVIMGKAGLGSFCFMGH